MENFNEVLTCIANRKKLYKKEGSAKWTIKDSKAWNVVSTLMYLMIMPGNAFSI